MWWPWQPRFTHSYCWQVAAAVFLGPRVHSVWLTSVASPVCEPSQADGMTTLENEVNWSAPPKSKSQRVQEGFFPKGKPGCHLQTKTLNVHCLSQRTSKDPSLQNNPLPPPLPARLEPLCLLIGPVNFILPKIFLTCAALGNSMFPEQALHMHVSSLIFCSFLFLVCLGSSRHLPGPSPAVNLTSPYPLHTPIFPPPLCHRSFGIIVKLYSN